MKIQEPPANLAVRFIEDPEIALAKLQKIRLALSDSAKNNPPIMAYVILFDTAIAHLTFSRNFYFPIPWETDTDLPSHPSLVADARHYCKNNGLPDMARVIVNSFAEWCLFKQQKIFCCCGKSQKERVVQIDIVIHHPINIDRQASLIEVKQLIGIRSTDRDHVENHYDLSRNSRVNNDISIIGTAFAKIGIQNLKLQTYEEKYAEQFDANFFRKIFSELYRGIVVRPT